MIYLVGDAPESIKYQKSDFEGFLAWISMQEAYQLDIETDVTQFYCNKKLITIQFGDMTNTNQWVIQYSALTEEQKYELRYVLENDAQLKLAHNAAFERIVLLFHGISIENIYDTMIAEKVLNGGRFDDDLSYSLAAVCMRYLNIELDKSEQTNFGDNVLTESKVLYAATDVQHLGAIYQQQLPKIKEEDLEWVIALEMEVLLSYCDMTYEGLELDQDMWRANIALAQPLIDAAKVKLDNWLRQEPFRKKATELGHISDVDRVHINWQSPKQREALLKLLFPDIAGASIGVVKKYIKDNPEHPLLGVLKDFTLKDYSLLEQMLVVGHRQALIDMEMLCPADYVVINWNSQKQVLPLFQVVEPKLKDLSADSFGKTTHPIIKDLEEYKDNLKLTTSYGEKFIEKHVEPDGKVRASYNQVVSTGRASCRNPNMQQVPAKEAVGNRYRNCFMAPKGFKFVDSDYSSAELVNIAHMSKDPVWIEALNKGYDLHSVCAELVYGKKWKDVAEDSCEYYKRDEDGNTMKQKCKCKKHKTMRNGVKVVNFGLCYGMSQFKLSGTLQISVKEAEQLIEDYFKAFPRIKKMLDYLGKFAIENGFSKTMAPFFRKRYYPQWEWVKDYVKAHIEGVEYNATLGAIERQGKNAPVQGSGADYMKLATVITRWYIIDNNLQHKVKLVAQVHDQLTTICAKDFAEEWKLILTSLLEQAAKVCIPSGLLKADTNITLRWSK